VRRTGFSLGTSSKTHSTGGAWDNVANRYLGLKFKINGKFHYGWARLSVKFLKDQFDISTILTGYAYETVPNKPIIAGQTKGPDISAAQSARLGHLAAGASAIPAWRVKQATMTTH